MLTAQPLAPDAGQAVVDEVDRRILELLERDARLSARAIARQIGMSPGAVSERVERLQARGVILGYHAHVNHDVVVPLAALVLLAACEFAPPRMLAVGVPVLLLALGITASVSASRAECLPVIGWRYWTIA